MGYNVAVVGATGNVGHEMLNILAEREFPANNVHAIASRKSIGREVSYGDKILKCEDLEQFDFSTVDFCLMSAGGSISKEWAPRIGATGCIVIDNSSAWRYDEDVPLVIPEVNADVLNDYMARNNRKNIIANIPGRADISISTTATDGKNGVCTTTKRPKLKTTTKTV